MGVMLEEKNKTEGQKEPKNQNPHRQTQTQKLTQRKKSQLEPMFYNSTLGILLSNHLYLLFLIDIPPNPRTTIPAAPISSILFWPASNTS